MMSNNNSYHKKVTYHDRYFGCEFSWVVLSRIGRIAAAESYLDEGMNE